ncbi:hypothetical protein BS47DRAFT_1374421 [Hydnum rufescens UP504]|uniref:Uncharacterized protein n=1 Tax=Hydnum rufescens UP504 TaxID=1448309 RepID=A0A9P6AEX6_9AGAM|nr:hypothetical protein BS47DRAFT_1374421 [Hydnum rufescens UP504]
MWLTSLRKWNNDGEEEVSASVSTGNLPLHTTIWYHDKSIFYAHDRWRLHWVHNSETPKPYAKGEGASLMVADFVSADYGWLHSPDGKSSAHVLLKPGENHDGYFTNDEVLDQVTAAMDILEKHYLNEDHVFIFNNTKTHSKRPEDSLSACHMPKGTSKPESNWGLKVNEHDAEGNLVYRSDGKLNKVFKHMGDGMFDGKPQSLYFADNHLMHPGLFKGMAVILEECGYQNAQTLHAQYPDFKCEKGAVNCYCHQLLFSEPDFIDVNSILEGHCRECGFTYPPSSTIEDVEKNALNALEAVPLLSMRRFSNHALRGLNGKEAAYATNKYRGHHQIPMEATQEVIQELMRSKKA